MMNSPLQTWFLFVSCSAIYQLAKIPLGFDPDWEDLATCAYWFGVAMAMVSFGIVAKKQEK